MMKPLKTDRKKRPGQSKMGAPLPTIMTPLGELSLAEAARLEREGKYPGRERP